MSAANILPWFLLKIMSAESRLEHLFYQAEERLLASHARNAAESKCALETKLLASIVAMR